MLPGHFLRERVAIAASITGVPGAKDVTAEDLGSAERIRTSASHTSVVRGGGDHATIAARRAQVQRQYEAAPPNIEQDKSLERLTKQSGGTAVLYAGGVTPVKQKRTIQLIEGSLHAVRAAAEEGVVAGGGSALAQIGPALDELLVSTSGDVAEGVRLVRSILTRPLWYIATNAGADAGEIITEVTRVNSGYGYNASTGTYQNMIDAGIIDPVRVTYTALRNAASVAKLILTTETLLAISPRMESDPTVGPALGGGAEKLGRP